MATKIFDWPLIFAGFFKNTIRTWGRRLMFFECSYTGRYNNTLVANPFLHRNRALGLRRLQWLWGEWKKRREARANFALLYPSSHGYF